MVGIQGNIPTIWACMVVSENLRFTSISLPCQNGENHDHQLVHCEEHHI